MLSPKGPWLLQMYLTHSNYRPIQQRRCLQWLLSISVIGTRPMQVPNLLNRSLAFSLPHPAYSFKKSHFMAQLMGLSRGKHEWKSIYIVISHKVVRNVNLWTCTCNFQLWFSINYNIIVIGRRRFNRTAANSILHYTNSS